ncbi:MAG: UPF0182 family protein [Vicinamibacterales bacterium]
MPKRPIRLAIAAAIAVLFMAGPSLVDFITDYLWFDAMGYANVFVTILSAQGVTFTAVFAVAALWLGLNLRWALGTVGDARPVFTTSEGLRVSLPGRRQMQAIANVATIIVAGIFGLFASGRWETFLAWWYAVPFDQIDPVLGRDAGFYVFTLPFLQLAHGLAQGLVVIAALTCGAVYFLSGSLMSGFPATLTLTPSARRHLSVLAAAFLLLLAAGAWLSRAELLVQPSSIIFGAGYADVAARMPAALLLAAVSLLGAGLALLQAFTPRNWPIPVAAGLYLAVTIGGAVYATALQRFVVTPNEQVREAPYIEHNIEATRRAFDLDDIEVREISGNALLTLDDIEQNAPTLENVRLWDHQPLLETFGQLQEIRTYYDFASIDNDRYVIDGRLRQVMLSARELNSNSLPNRTWVNERLTFTHGYGLALGPVNQVTPQGLPELFVQDLPPITSAGPTIDEPSIYFGELSSDYVIVHSDTEEFHYPRGDVNEFTQYRGDGGLPLASLGRQILFAARFGAYQIILSDDITPESRILFNRNIRERARLLAPFLSFDQDPYLVIADGRLFWILDAYTTSGRYPYSTRAGGGLNYIRNSAKFTIDAFHGTTTAYLAEPDDPIAATYQRIFPGLFRPIAEMPASLRSHVRYPQDIFAIQASVFATYHMTDPDVFYNREDQWEIPALGEGNQARLMEPYYTIMRLQGEEDAEFIQMLPFTPRQRDNLAAWLVARSDGEQYGRMQVSVFPTQTLVFGPRQVVARINQDQAIAPQVTLWNQQGSQVNWGTLMVIPVEESLIYVRPLYLRAAGGRIPELRRVVVAYGNQIVMEPTLDAAMARLFAGAPATPLEPVPESEGADMPDAPPPAPGEAAPGASLAVQAQATYERALAAQRAGDWATYGAEIQRLGAILAQMQAAP